MSIGSSNNTLTQNDTLNSLRDDCINDVKLRKYLFKNCFMIFDIFEIISEIFSAMEKMYEENNKTKIKFAQLSVNINKLNQDYYFITDDDMFNYCANKATSISNSSNLKNLENYFMINKIIPHTILGDFFLNIMIDNMNINDSSKKRVYRFPERFKVRNKFFHLIKNNVDKEILEKLNQSNLSQRNISIINKLNRNISITFTISEIILKFDKNNPQNKEQYNNLKFYLVNKYDFDTLMNENFLIFVIDLNNFTIDDCHHKKNINQKKKDHLKNKHKHFFFSSKKIISSRLIENYIVPKLNKETNKIYSNTQGNKKFSLQNISKMKISSFNKLTHEKLRKTHHKPNSNISMKKLISTRDIESYQKGKTSIFSFNSLNDDICNCSKSFKISKEKFEKLFTKKLQDNSLTNLIYILILKNIKVFYLNSLFLN